VTDHSSWAAQEKATHLLAILLGHAADILHSVPAEATYEDTVGVLKGHYGDHQLAAAYQLQFKARTQLSSSSLQEFTMAVKQLAHWTVFGLPEDFIQR
jgi:hypothetical protein